MIANKILNVMTKIGPIIKDKTNEKKGFEYASLANIILKAREAMIEEKIIIIPHKVEQIMQKGNDITISMIYRFYDTEKNEKDENEYIDVNIAGEGCDKEGWAIYKALSGAYKYAITQTFSIPTLDDAEKSKLTNNSETENEETEEAILEGGGLNENKIESILGDPSVEDFNSLFELGGKAM